MSTPEEVFFVQACAWGRMEEIHQYLSAGNDVNAMDESINEDVDFDSPDSRKRLHQLFTGMAMGKIRNTQGMTGAGAAMQYHQLGVLEILKQHNADFSNAGKFMFGKLDFFTAVEVGIQSGFWQGVDKLISEYGEPLWTRADRPADDLLFMAVPYVRSIHHFGHKGDVDSIAKARELDNKIITDGLDTLDYLVRKHGLDIHAVNKMGKPLLNFAEPHSSDGFWGEGGRVIKHLMKLGCNPNQESVETNEKTFKLEFSESANESLGEMLGIDDDKFDFADYFKKRIARSRQFNTTVLIQASFDGDNKKVELFLTDKRSDPLYVDRHGHTAVDAVAIGEKFNARTEGRKAQYESVKSLLADRVRKKYGIGFVLPEGALNPN